jgi:hypothetical protein
LASPVIFTSWGKQGVTEIFKRARQEFQKDDMASTSTVQQNKEAPEYEIPPPLDHTNEMQPMGQVSKIKGFLQSCI